jgi:hypothetical protein
MSNVTLDELLDSLGFKKWESITNSIVVPILCFFGSVSCSISAFIFFLKPFSEQVFFYYRLHSVLNVFTLLFNIFFGVCFSPRFMPNQDTYLCAVYNAVSIWLNHFMFHYLDVIEICILLERMKIFSPFVKKHFKAPPWTVSFILFVTCVLVDVPFLYACKPGPMGDYYFTDSMGVKQNGQLYNIIPTKIAFTFTGSLFLTISNLISNSFTLIVCVTLNVVSLIQYKSYLTQRRRTPRDVSSQPLTLVTKRKLKRERRSEKNMFYMIITLCFVSIISRFAFMANFVYYLFDFTFSGGLVLNTLSKVIYNIVPSMSIFIFVSFNKIFRNEIRRIFFLSTNDANVSTNKSNSSSNLKNSKLTNKSAQSIPKLGIEV